MARPIKYTEVPSIPANLDKSQLHMLIPEGFAFIDTEFQNSTLVIKILKADIEDTELRIEEVMYNPQQAGTYFPLFLFETSTLTTRKITYTKDSVLNQNQMLYMLIQHRLCQFQEQIREGRSAYGYLLQNDIAELCKFMQYVRPKAYNAIQAINNTWVLLSPWDMYTATLSNLTMKNLYLGDVLKNGRYKPSKENLKLIFKALDIQPSSESSASKTGKVVVHPHDVQLYRSVGFKTDHKTNSLTSIFPPKQNVVARLKTHLIADAYELKDSANSVFFQDNLPNQEKKIYEPKDLCLRKTVVVFESMDRDSQRFVCGEIEVSKSFAETELFVEETITEQFEEVYIQVGETITSQSGRIKIGMKLDETEKYIHAHEVKCISRTLVGLLGVEKVRLKIKRAVGNSRIDSNTGLKGVTKVKGNLGTIQFPDQTIVPEMIVGMNATKAKVNTIVLAQAALAVDLGYYKPKSVYGLLNTLDEKEINEAAKSLPQFVYTNEFNEVKEVFVGLAYPRVTELASTYGQYKDMSFMFESGRLLAQNGNRPLFEHIWKTQIKEKHLNLITELQKILLDKGFSYPDDNLPRYSPAKLLKDKIVTRNDLLTSKLQASPFQSVLLDEEWNKGFYLDLSSHGCKMIRIPSAQMLNSMIHQLPDKMWIYPSIFVTMCKILGYALPNAEGRLNIGYIQPRNKTDRMTESKRYYEDIKGTLYTSETNSQMVMQKLLKLKLKGSLASKVQIHSSPITQWLLCVVRRMTK